MKKIVAMILAALMLLTVVGCGGGATTKTEKTYVVLNDKLAAEEYGIGFRKDSNVTEMVNGILAELAADGTLQRLADTYGVSLADGLK